MKISTVMATYNGEKYILKQIESIFQQSRKVDEVIFVDDCSKDKTVEIIKDFIICNQLQENWFVYENEKNLGYKGNFKKAFEYTTGDIIILSDQDDIWEVDKTESFEQIFAKSNALAINASFRFIDGEDKYINETESNNNNNLLKKNYMPDEFVAIPFETILANNISPGCTMAIAKELKDIFLEVSKGILPHDWELNIIAALYERLYFYNKKLTRYRIHGENEIGMNTDMRTYKLTPNTSYERRCHNILERLQLGNFVAELKERQIIETNDYEVFKKLYSYDELRYKCVVEKKTFIWFKMLIYGLKISKYDYVRKRELAGDLYFSITGKK